MHGTRCPIRPQDSKLISGLRLPSGISRSLGIKAFHPSPSFEAYPCRLPDLPSLPAARQQFYSSLSATDHRSGSATSCQARCPSNLLEPQSSCFRNGGSVNRKIALSSGNNLPGMCVLGLPGGGRFVNKAGSAGFVSAIRRGGRGSSPDPEAAPHRTPSDRSAPAPPGIRSARRPW